MSDYTPTTEDVREAVAEWCWSRRMWLRSLAQADGYEFDRWLEGVQREARAEGALWAMSNGYAGTRITDINTHETGSTP